MAAVTVKQLSAQLGMPHHLPVADMRMTGKHVGTIDLPMQNLAVIRGRQEFTLVPWRPELLRMRLLIMRHQNQSGCLGTRLSVLKH